LPESLAAVQILSQGDPGASPVPLTSDQIRRMRWWHEAKFGMFIHFGRYSDHARHEWVMEIEAIPFSEYTPLAKTFNPTPSCARDWVKLEKTAGMKYMVMTTKHHESFCNFRTTLSETKFSRKAVTAPPL
jgi:alpha-L-fucosidase